MKKSVNRLITAARDHALTLQQESDLSLSIELFCYVVLLCDWHINRSPKDIVFFSSHFGTNPLPLSYAYHTITLKMFQWNTCATYMDGPYVCNHDIVHGVFLGPIASPSSHESPFVLESREQRAIDLIFSDARWHYSYCFQSLENFIFKMTGFNLTDRVIRTNHLSYLRMQKIICRGDNLFDMLPEKYTFRGLTKKIDSNPRSALAVHIPTYFIQNANRFRCLLPNGCVRIQDFIASP
ncbi:hypothetical protein CXB51_014932 [Gossypium anomalum]|uniref:Uncharacterized protein n=1 Tax=Gossypium anomalum TaxID=47600 RepID=A0A8J6D0T6_9ROSI|nr:hypothetical protein CXB51_014932 [Gossypium anomalum]